MTEERTDKPREFVADLPQEWWRDWRKLLALAVAVVAIGVGVAAFVLLRAGEDDDLARSAGVARRETPSDARPADDPGEPTSSPGATEPPAATVPTPSVSASTPPSAGGEATSTSSAPGTETAKPKSAALVAFRSGGAIWVAGEDGKSPKALLAAAEGAYALSPDSRTLAVVAQGTLTLVDVATGSAASVGPAVAVSRLSWAADSSAVAYAAPASSGGDIMLVDRDGGGGRLLVKGGTDPALSSDGEWIACIDAERRARVAPLARAGTAESDIETGGVTALCWGSGGTLFFATKPGQAPELASRVVDGAKKTPRKLSSARAGVVFGDLYASPDGKRLLFAERGDDGFSRTYVIGADGKGKTLVPCLRDAYPAGWSADGTRVFYFEGNAFQGQSTRLTSARADGTGRVTVAEGAAR